MRNRTAEIATKVAVGAIGLVLLAVTLTTLFGGGYRPASASPTTTCPTYPAAATMSCHGTTTTTVSGSTTSTTTSTQCPAAAAPTLTSSYSKGILTWQATGLPSSDANFSAQIYVDGQIVPGGTTKVLVGGCTQVVTDPICLAVGVHTVTVVAPDANPSTLLDVTSSGCGAAAAAGTTTTSKGALAFTGSHVALLVFVAALLLLVGFFLTKVARQRRRPVRHHHRHHSGPRS